VETLRSSYEKIVQEAVRSLIEETLAAHEFTISAMSCRSVLNPNQKAVSIVGIATRVVSPLNARSDHEPSAKK
jgi:hypothetical protein